MKFDAKNIHAVLFDLDDTLYDIGGNHENARRALFDFLSEKLGVPRAEVERVYLEARDRNQKNIGNTGSAYSRLLYIQKCIEFLKGKTNVRLSLAGEEIFWNTFISGIQLREGAMDLLLDLRSRGIKIGIVSNLTAQVQMKKIIQLGLDAVCDILVTSEEAGENKPGAKPFLLALEKLGCTPAEAVMVGDYYEVDVVGADTLGLGAVYFLTGRNSDPKDPNTIVVRSFGELKAMFC